MSVRKSSHGTIFLIVSSGSPLALIASSLRSTSKKPVCPMTRSLHPPMAHCRQRVRFAATWREEFFEVPICLSYEYHIGESANGHDASLECSPLHPFRVVFCAIWCGGLVMDDWPERFLYRR